MKRSKKICLVAISLIGVSVWIYFKNKYDNDRQLRKKIKKEINKFKTNPKNIIKEKNKIIKEFIEEKFKKFI